MSVDINGETFTTFEDYINNESNVSKDEKLQIEYKATLIGRHITNTQPYSGPTPSEYNLRALARYVKQKNIQPTDLTEEELKQFRNS